MDNKYIAFTDFRFVDEAKSELRSIFGDATLIRPLYGELMLFDVARPYDNAIGAFTANKPTFLYGLLKVSAEVSFNGDYYDIVTAMSSIMDMGKRFRIEVKKVWTPSEETAKDIEVLLGRALEGKGFVADLKDPKVALYVILVNGKALICMLDMDRYGAYTLDIFRAANKRGYVALNRSEHKLAEAVEAFHLVISPGMSCLDIGAAPGGWSHYMLRHGARVVAVDGAWLDYKKLEAKKAIVITDDDGHAMNGIDIAKPYSMPEDIAAYDLVHIKSRAEDAVDTILDKVGQFDIVTVDMNTVPEESAKVVKSMAHAVKSGGCVVLTAKLVNNKLHKLINDAERVLSDDYGEFAVKKLPHDRMELTIFAKRK